MKTCSRTMTLLHRGPRGASVPEVRWSTARQGRKLRRFRYILEPRTWIIPRLRLRSRLIAPIARTQVTTWTTTTITCTTWNQPGTIITTSGIMAANERSTSKNEEKSRRRRDFHPRVRQHRGEQLFCYFSIIINLFHSLISENSIGASGGSIYLFYE